MRHALSASSLAIALLGSPGFAVGPGAAAPEGPAILSGVEAVAAPAQRLDFGFGLQLDRPSHAPGDAARATLFFFNLTPEDASGALADPGGLGCRYEVVIRDSGGRRVWRPIQPCPLAGTAPAGPFLFPAGTFLEIPVDLVMAYRSSETGDRDGEPLPGGAYLLEAQHDYTGPVGPEPDAPATGRDPRAELPFRIVQCGGATGQMPARELGSGDSSGYSYGDPGFAGENLVLRTREAALEFWRRHTANLDPPPPPPAVDFATEMVLVTLLGTQTSGGGPSTRIVSVEEHGCHVAVRVLENRRPGPLAVVTNPYHAVAVRRSLKEVVFEEIGE